ncbi:hypothetical protein CRE_06825 [Caenorhabditis remanei]|uniref:DUF7809 domain-containing protein n=1 Tax=Caenorhabditis remanei TaxID=31234 RepID=E3MP10_CAERE|nr:hypothetical protein CRE_06825 [Caenorhabditis remanei]
MSKFLEIPYQLATPMYLHAESLGYILEEFRADLEVVDNEDVDNGQNVKFMQKMFDKSGYKLRMYGSAQELAENVRIFSNFSQNHTYFNVEEEHYQKAPILYKSLKSNEKYILKSDLFVFLQNMVLEFTHPNRWNYVSLIAYCLKAQEDKLTECLEFVKFNEEVADDLEKKLKHELKKKPFTNVIFEQLEVELSRLNMDQMTEKFKNLAPKVNWDSNIWKSIRIHSLLTDLNEIWPIREIPRVMAATFMRYGLTLRSLQDVIDENPKMFRPSDTKTVPTVVRVFEDEDRSRYVMKAELSGEVETDTGDSQILHTMSMESVIETKDIEFILHRITRAKHRAAPIKGPNKSKSFYILAVDAFFELMKDLIFGIKIYQKVQWNSMNLESFDNFFNPEIETPYFLKTDTVKKIKESVCLSLGKDASRPAKEVRNAKSDGFTLQNLKNELKHLGLTETFTEIQDYAKDVYVDVYAVKKKYNLRTCDLFDAIEQCQLICVLNRSEKLKKFVHNQRGCERVPGLNCADCAEKDCVETTCAVS